MPVTRRLYTIEDIKKLIKKDIGDNCVDISTYEHSDVLIRTNDGFEYVTEGDAYLFQADLAEYA